MALCLAWDHGLGTVCLRNSEPIGIDLAAQVQPGDISPVQIGTPVPEAPRTDQGASGGFRRKQKGIACEATKRLMQSCSDMLFCLSVPCISKESMTFASLDSVLALGVSSSQHASIALQIFAAVVQQRSTFRSKLIHRQGTTESEAG
jgi:hypothetical protein